MYQALITKIKQTLEQVDLVKEAFAYPSPKITKYPAVIFFPNDFTNAYETNVQNSKEYRFKMFVIVELKNLSEQDAFETVLPKVVDGIIAKFDADWDMGTLNGSRVTALLGAGMWAVAGDERGKEAYAELNLTVRALTSN